MKIYIKKTVSVLLASLICFSCFIGGITVSAEETYIDCAESNFDFAVKTAEIIKNDDDEASMLRIIGKFRPDAADLVFPNISDSVVSDDGRFVLQFSTEEDLISCLEELNKNPDIIYAERDMPVYTGTVQKSAEHLSWGVEAIEADVYSQAIAPSVSDRSVTVAIVDSGSEDIAFIKDKLVQGYDFFDNDNDAFQDDSIDSHGTFLASIVADCTANLPVKIMPVRVLDSKTGSLINLLNGIHYAVDNGADIINLSLCAILKNCKALENAIDYAQEKGVTVVVCAGNAKSDIENYCPSHVENALTVTSVNSDFIFSESFSNFGNVVDLAAPGENITGYNALGEKMAMSGTSLSTAFVSAGAAMFLLDNPGCSAEQVASALTSNALDLGTAGKDTYYGWGLLKLKGLIVPKLRIKNNSGSKTINHGETLRLTAETANQPDNTSVWWYVNVDKSGEGNTFEVSPESGSVEVTAKLVDANGIVIKDNIGNEISDSQTVSVNSGFFWKIISFFKNLFKINRTVIQTLIRL